MFRRQPLNILVDVRHALLYVCAVKATRKKFKVSSDGGDYDGIKRKRGYGGIYGKVWRSLRSVEVWSQENSFVLVLASVAAKISSHLIYFLIKFYKFHTSKAICKATAAINGIIFEHKKFNSRRLYALIRDTLDIFHCNKLF
jgi:hypothetical protein